jgi:hypothetical protein
MNIDNDIMIIKEGERERGRERERERGRENNLQC